MGSFFSRINLLKYVASIRIQRLYERKLTKGGKNGMNDGKLGSSFSCTSFKIPSSAFLILCCILSLRT